MGSGSGGSLKEPPEQSCEARTVARNMSGIEPDTGVFEGFPRGWDGPLSVLYLSYEKSRLNLCKVLD